MTGGCRGMFSGPCGEPGRIKGVGYGHRIEIDAPAELVWDLLADFGNWANWNPLYGETVGCLNVGQTLSCMVKLEGLKPQKVKARVYKVVPKELLEYGTSNMGGLVQAYRYIEVSVLSPSRCQVVNGEIMGGFLGQHVISRLVGQKVASGLKSMNHALMFMAERKSRAQDA